MFSMFTNFDRFSNALRCFMYLISKWIFCLRLIKNNFFSFCLMNWPIKIWLSLIHKNKFNEIKIDIIYLHNLIKNNSFHFRFIS
jgi:hypothetical protein